MMMEAQSTNTVMNTKKKCAVADSRLLVDTVDYNSLNLLPLNKPARVSRP